MYTCPNCNKSYKNPSSVYHHKNHGCPKKIPINEISICPDCGRNLENLIYITKYNHVISCKTKQTTIPSQFKCNCCQKQYLNRGCYNKHIINCQS
jgi:hypothetical protein